MATIACVFAHPDDESFGPGGTIAKLAKTNDIYIICCTDGDYQNNGLKNIRDKELLASAQILGVKEVIFLNFTDGSLSNNLYHQLADSLTTHLQKLKPSVLMTFHPNGVSGHIDHITVTSVVDFLFQKLGFVQKIMYFCMRDTERSQISDYFVFMPAGIPKKQADEIIDVSAVWDTKVRAIRQHQSQIKDVNWILEMQESLPRQEYFIVRSRGE